jgi:hypothetical protein
VTCLEGACMFSLDVPTSECYNTNGSEIMKFVIAAIVLLHLLFLHQTWSNNSLGLDKNTDKIPFHPYFTVKDILGFAIIITLLTVLTLKELYILRELRVDETYSRLYMQSMYVCMSVLVCISIFLWGKPVTVMATSTSISWTAHFTLNRYHVKKILPIPISC